MEQNQKKLSEDDLKSLDPLSSPKSTKRRFEVKVIGKAKKINSMDQLNFSSLQDNKKVVKKGRFSICFHSQNINKDPIRNKYEEYDFLDLIPRNISTQTIEKQAPLVPLN